MDAGVVGCATFRECSLAAPNNVLKKRTGTPAVLELSTRPGALSIAGTEEMRRLSVTWRIVPPRGPWRFRPWLRSID